MVSYPVTKQQRTIPRIKGLPLLGSLSAFEKDRLELFMRVVREYGDLGCFYFGPYPVIQINHPALVHSLLVEHAYDFDKGEDMHKVFEPLIGNGIFISEGDFHRHQRKLMAPSFQPRHIMKYADTMVRRANPQERDDFLSILLSAHEEDGSTMSNEQLRNEALTLFSAGHKPDLSRTITMRPCNGLKVIVRRRSLHA